MGLFDWFKASVVCPGCGARSESVLLGQTKLHPAARQNELTVGDALPLSAEGADDARYRVLTPAPEGEGRILQMWEYPGCCSRSQWFEVVVAGGRIASIEPIRLTLAKLQSANYIDDESLFAASAHLPGSPPILTDPSLALRLLRRSLEDAGPQAGHWCQT